MQKAVERAAFIRGRSSLSSRFFLNKRFPWIGYEVEQVLKEQFQEMKDVLDQRNTPEILWIVHYPLTEDFVLPVQAGSCVNALFVSSDTFLAV